MRVPALISAQKRGKYRGLRRDMQSTHWITTLAEKRHRNLHLGIITAFLFAHAVVQYSAYIPGSPQLLTDLAFSRFRVIFDMDLLIVVIYAGSMFRIKGGSIALAVMAVTLMPLLFTLGGEADITSSAQIRNQAIEVGLVLLIGTLTVTLQEMMAAERASREKLGDKLDTINRQLTALNRLAQRDLNLLFIDLREAVEEEQRLFGTASAIRSEDTYASVLS